MEERTHKPIPIEDMPILGVVLLLIAPQTEIVNRKLANRLHALFMDKLWKRCKDAAQKHFGHTKDWEEIAEEICMDTFQLLFEKLSTFKFKEECTDKEAFKIISSWLARTANIKILNHIKKQVSTNKKFEDYKKFLDLHLEHGTTLVRKTETTYDLIKFRETWENLNPLAKEIVMLSMEYDCLPSGDSKNTKHLPDDILEGLCLKYDTSKENIRKTKQKALERLLSCKTT